MTNKPTSTKLEITCLDLNCPERKGKECQHAKDINVPTKPTLNDKLIAAIAYKNPNNDLLQNIETMTEIWTVLIKRKDEVIKMLEKETHVQ